MRTIWVLLALAATAAFVITYQFVAPPPPKLVRIATGPTDGAYYAFSQRYAGLLARDGITLETVSTAGAVQNLELLKQGAVSLALVQGGAATEQDRQELQSLGSLFLEPVWVFTKTGSGIRRLSDLKGKRVGVGPAGSGTNLLATQLLAVNGATESNTELVQADASDSAQLIESGRIDAAIVVAAPRAPVVRQILQTSGIQLLDLARTKAYDRLFSFLTPVTLSEGVLDLQQNLPNHDARLVAAPASLAARKDLNATLIPALLNAVTRVHENGGVIEAKREFPSADLVDLPINDDAERYIRNGPSFLYRWLPYGTAVLLDRLKFLLLPFIGLLIPLIRIAPPLYQWRVRSKIYRWYAEVREIDRLLISGESADIKAVSDRLAELEREVAAVSVPLAYTGEQYHLRMHIRLLQDRLQTVLAAGAAGHRTTNDATAHLA